MATPEVILVTAMETLATPATAVVPAGAVLDLAGETRIQVRAATAARARTNKLIVSTNS
jgi:hypothetical protein